MGCFTLMQPTVDRMHRADGCTATAVFVIIDTTKYREGYQMTATDMKIAERIQQLRKSKGLSQEQLAAQLDVSRQAVSKWESGVSLR